MHTRYDDDAGWFTMVRGPVTVALNLDTVERTVAVTGRELLLVSGDGIRLGEGSVTLPPDSVAVVGG